MKRKLLIAVLFCIIVFSGCDVKEEPTFECVSDEMPMLPACYLTMDLPANVFLTESGDHGRFAVFSHQNYEIIQEIFRADSIEQAIHYLSGRDSADLSIFSLDKETLRFAWTVSSDEGDTACNAILLSDGTYYYSLLIRCPASMEKNYREDFSEIFASTQLRWV